MPGRAAGQKGRPHCCNSNPNWASVFNDMAFSESEIRRSSGSGNRAGGGHTVPLQFEPKFGLRIQNRLKPVGQQDPLPYTDRNREIATIRRLGSGSG
jgi:hypothetical protein